MRLRESTIIAADADAVWPFLADPALQADWNPKVVSVERKRSGPVQFGERFEMIYRMSGRDRHTLVEVMELQIAQRVVYFHRINGKSAERIVEEAYEISPDGDGVRVVQTIDLTRAGIPWLLRLFIGLIHRYGWSAEEPYLERLKHLVEPPATAAAE